MGLCASRGTASAGLTRLRSNIWTPGVTADCMTLFDLRDFSDYPVTQQGSDTCAIAPPSLAVSLFADTPLTFWDARLSIFFIYTIFFPYTTCLFSRSLAAPFRSVRLPFRALNGNVAALSMAILPRFERLSCRVLKGSFLDIAVFSARRTFGSI